MVSGDQLAPEVLERYLEAGVRFPLTFNLKQYLLERFKADEEIPFEPITVLFRRLPSVPLFEEMVTRLRSSPITEGDIVEIQEYTLVSDRKTEAESVMVSS